MMLLINCWSISNTCRMTSTLRATWLKSTALKDKRLRASRPRTAETKIVSRPGVWPIKLPSSACIRNGGFMQMREQDTGCCSLVYGRVELAAKWDCYCGGGTVLGALFMTYRTLGFNEHANMKGVHSHVITQINIVLQKNSRNTA